MADTVHVPGIKKPLPKLAVAAGVGGVGVAIILYYRHKKTAPAGMATDQYPPDGTVGDPSDPYSTDPATGQTYGDEAAGSGGTFGAYGGGSGSGGDGSGGGSGGGGGGGQGGPPFATNDAWANWVIQQEQTINPGVDSGKFEDAIGLYLNGQPLDPAQKQYVFDARAIAGDPPVAAADGYPPKIRSDGHKGGKQNADNPVKDLKVAVTGDATVTVSWDASKNATGYHVVTRQGTKTFSVHDITGTSIGLHSMHPGTQYTTTVLAKPAASGAKAASVTYTTRRKAKR